MALNDYYQRLSVDPAPKPKPRLPQPPAGTVGTLRNIAMEEGVTGLYAGLPSTLALAVPSNILYFWTYEIMRDNMRASKNSLVAASSSLVAGGASRMVAAVACAPIEVVRTRVQAARIVSNKRVVGCDGGTSMAVLRQLLRKEGPGALFCGLESTLWRDVPFSAFYWYGVETIRNEMLRRHFWEGSPWQAPFASLAAGSLAGSAAAFATTPFDVVKTRRQVEGSELRGLGARSRSGVASVESSGSASLWSTLARMARDEGVPALFTGATPRVARVTPACGIMLGSYELVKVLLLASTGKTCDS